MASLLGTRAVVFDDVCYRYPGRDEPALTGVSLELPPGATVAVVGRSGAGKTTLSSLLLRFADPTEGRIMVGPAALGDVSLAAWRASVAWLPQQPHLLTATVAENVRLARPGASEAEVRAALHEANVLDVVEALPGGIDARLHEEASNLSAGQRRRLALARVFLRDAPLVVVYEPTAHLDAESRSAVLDALGRLRGRATLVVVAHRPLLASDLVVEVDAGRVRTADEGVGPWVR